MGLIRVSTGVGQLIDVLGERGHTGESLYATTNLKTRFYGSFFLTTVDCLERTLQANEVRDDIST